ncbi:MAG: 3'-5' exonuclease [Candidatus Rokuibacteriota bacterium]|nr:MAG: 3'-5' exonuclease [Candidatus Rokubacteria bacterium]
MDPLAVADLAPLAPLFADPAIVLVVHAGSNDLAELKSRYGFTFASIFDTSIAARLLGARELGLEALLGTFLGVTLPPSRQRDDWSARPLTPAQETYAAADVEHLFPLKARLTEALMARGRLGWAKEECEALAAQPAPDRTLDPQAFLGVKGARDLGPRALGILRELYQARERSARAFDRPPFKIVSDEMLLAIAITVPADPAALARVPGATPRMVARWGPMLLDAVARGEQLPGADLPRIERGSRPPGSAAAKRRAEKLKAWRTAAATREGLDPGVLLPNRLIGAIADAGPRTVDELLAVDGVRRWRVEAFGPELLLAVTP